MLRITRSRVAAPTQQGQTLVEFALALPIIVFLLMAVLEVSLAFNAFVGINRVSQIGAQLAAIMTNQEYADCIVLNEIESRVESPNRRSNIVSVVIQRTALGGNRAFQEQYYERGGSLDCEIADGETVRLPYHLSLRDLPSYPYTDRCPVLKGCPYLGDDRTTVDNIGVAVRYRHEWVTPLSVVTEYLPGGNQGWNFTQRNIFRMEPTL